MTRGNGTVMGYSYDPVGRLSCLTDNLAGGATPGCTPAATGSDRAATFAWNPAGQIAALSQANDTSARTGSVNVDRTYAGNGLYQHIVRRLRSVPTTLAVLIPRTLEHLGSPSFNNV